MGISVSQLNKITVEKLLPHFPGAQVANSPRTKRPRKGKLVAYDSREEGGRLLQIWPSKTSTKCVEVFRTQAFSAEEKSFAEAFITELGSLADLSPSTAFENALSHLDSAVIARVALPENLDLANYILMRLLSWTELTYEGKPVAASFGVNLRLLSFKKLPWPIDVQEFCSLDVGKVLGNGMDTLIQCDQLGRVRRLVDLVSPMVFSQEQDSVVPAKFFGPRRFGDVARWTSVSGRVAFLLTRNREILIFKSGSLLASRRNGRWQYYTHIAVATQMNIRKKESRRLREAVYETCLDASFARSGACIAIVDTEKSVEIREGKHVKVEELISRTDLNQPWDDHPPESPKQRLFYWATQYKSRLFQDLPRALRQDLSACDGAVVLDSAGRIISFGAIVSVPGGSDGGGGRKAAAVALSRFGVAIKVSSDGPMTFFKDRVQYAALGQTAS